jgi:hypothetical protein
MQVIAVNRQYGHDDEERANRLGLCTDRQDGAEQNQHSKVHSSVNLSVARSGPSVCRLGRRLLRKP